MAKTDLSVPSLGDKFIDLRETIPGDAYNFSWTRPLTQVKYLAIHHTAAPDTQTPEEIANYHINKNGWGGIGYHFVIGKDGTVYYVGDISTARANVANMNEAVIGICLVGNFTAGKIPSKQQLDSAHKLCEFLINYPNLPNLDSWDKVLGHQELPQQAVTCPGENWSVWKPKIMKVVKGNPSGSEPEEAASLRDQVASLQTTLASLNQQVIFLQETVQEREQQINKLKAQPTNGVAKVDTTLTIAAALINLYKFILPRKTE